MKILISNIALDLNENPEKLRSLAARKLNLTAGDIIRFRIVKESLDARKKNRIHFIYSVMAETHKPVKLPDHPDIRELIYEPEEPLIPGRISLTHRPVIIGSGPAGLFAALQLSQNGYRPLIIERGDEVIRRTETVQRFWLGGTLDPESNVQFGEGGAGTFSDGKLTTRIHDPRCERVLKELELSGVPGEILYRSKPHIGTDRLKEVLKVIRKRITDAGGEFRFRTRMTGLVLKENRIAGVKLSDGSTVPAETVILAIGHSARDTFLSLNESGITLVQKPFSMGVRIEHPQELINQAQFGAARNHPRLGAAEYSLFQKFTDRTAYSFCMCPGGLVVAAASEENTVVTNGMSEYARNRINANSALVVSVEMSDFISGDPLAGIQMQRELEQKAFKAGGSTAAAPVQRLEDFLKERRSIRAGSVTPGYTGSTFFTDLHQCLPGWITRRLKEAIPQFDRKLKGFALPDAILTGVETRTSSPVRILRGENFQSVSTPGLYPAGEGAGYAGGIMSAAVDGLRVSEALIREYQPAD
jgi:hypothetical protein